MLMNAISVKAKGMIKGIDFDLNQGKLFISCYDNKTVYYCKLSEPVTAESMATVMAKHKGAKNPREVAYWPFRDELYVGYGTGTISCYEVNNIDSGPICKFFK